MWQWGNGCAQNHEMSWILGREFVVDSFATWVVSECGNFVNRCINRKLCGMEEFCYVVMRHTRSRHAKNYCILWIDVVFSKLSKSRHQFKKMNYLENWTYQKKYFTKNELLNWYIFKWKTIKKISVDFLHRKLTFNVKFWHFFRICHYVNLQNAVISFADINFWPKI